MSEQIFSMFVLIYWLLLSKYYSLVLFWRIIPSQTVGQICSNLYNITNSILHRLWLSRSY